MTTAHPTPEHELEEAAQGHDLFEAPGKDLHIEDARDQAEASGWLPPEVVYKWPAPDTHGAIVRRRKNLHDLMIRLENALARSSRLEGWRDEVGEALEAVAQALVDHTAEIEAPGGLFAQVIERAPHMAVAVDSLREEHDELEQVTRRVLGMARSEEALDPAHIRSEAMTVVDLLANHRQTGAELLYDVYNLDLGGSG